ncbi:unnamed protein product [Porites evermanni]|uniref:Uncharacterized protein n=1 Tax=Porites evermanni TaxID=104178 RepID=A0ABN8RPT6_9CNID|nr:unnamed protein product [Porites evermanni]
MLEAMFHVKINGPALGSPKMESLLKQAVDKWLSKKNRKKLPSRQHAPLTTTEAPLPVPIPKEVADVSIQTVSVEEDDVISIQADAVEENALYEVQHQVEEVSTLLDISNGLPDSEDYDSAFESDSGF